MVTVAKCSFASNGENEPVYIAKHYPNQQNDTTMKIMTFLLQGIMNSTKYTNFNNILAVSQTLITQT